MNPSGKTGMKPYLITNRAMNITLNVNGKAQEAAENTSILQLLETLGLSDKPVVIEHNKTAIFPRDYKDIILSENDQLEIISIAAGG